MPSDPDKSTWAAATESTEHRRALKIFLVEDHSDTLKCISSYLEARGHTVMGARTMAEALALWPLDEHDMIISDLRLPDGDGWELLQRLPLSRPLYSLAISGLGMATDRARSRSAGYRRHLSKPFELKHLDAALQEAEQEAGRPGMNRLRDHDCAG